MYSFVLEQLEAWNGCFGGMRCIATKAVPRLRRDAASAMAVPAQGRFVRFADLRPPKMLRHGRMPVW